MHPRYGSTPDRELSLEGARVHYRRLGQGPDVVFLHGLLGMGRQWSAAVDLLAQHFTCWIPELPGISWSDPIADSSLPGLSAWLERVLAAWDLTGAFYLVASSWGGAVALEFASSVRRQRLSRLVLAAPAHPYWRPSFQQRCLMMPPLTRLAGVLLARLPESVHADLLSRSYGDPARMPPGAGAGYHRLLRRRGLDRAAAAYVRTWKADQRRLRSALGRLLLPTLLVWGSRDPVIPAASASALLEHLPDGRCALLPGAGHIPFDEDPAAFAGVIEPFMAA